MIRRLNGPLLAAAAAASLAVAGCGIFAQGASPSPAGPAAGSPAAGSPAASADRGAAGVRAQLAGALSARNLILTDAKVPFRPGEPAELGNVARTVYQVQLRDDPQGGFIVVYDLPTTELAAVTGRTLAAWLATGPGRVQAPIGTVHVLRQVAAAVVYYRWLPAAAIDPDTAKIQAALETVGIGIPVAG